MTGRSGALAALVFGLFTACRDTTGDITTQFVGA